MCSCGRACTCVRMCEGAHGCVRMRMRFTLAFEYRYHPALSPLHWYVVCPEDVIECFHYAFWFVFQYDLDCLYREFIWPQAFPFPIFAICLFTSSNDQHSTGPSVVGNSSSCSLGFSALKSL